MHWTAKLWVAMAALIVTTSGITAAHAKPFTINHGWVVWTGDMSPMIFEKRDILKDYGKTYTVDPIHFKGTSPQLQALATGQIQIASLAYSSFANGILNAHLTDMRIVADGFQDGVNGYASIQYMVKNGSGIKRIEDLKGKILGINVIGAAVDIGARAALLKHGLVAGRDYTIIESPFAAIGAMLLEGKADVVSMVPPFLYAPQVQKGAHTLFTMKDGMGSSQMIVLVARESDLQKHRKAYDDFFEDMVRGIHWMLNPANRTAAIAFAAKTGKLPVARLSGWYLTNKDQYRDPNGVPDLAAFQRNVDAQVKFGFLKHSFDAKKYADLSFIKRAAQRYETASR
ncbi:MAG TPA: ABC transporter substrate-binding protein [Stellaceae bacterium]|nr:ABC transporter substrate-binding protein [Stellaceae bacterium]